MAEPAPPRPAPAWATLLIGGAGSVFAIVGFCIAIGVWRGKTDELDRRLAVVEQIQRTNLPTFYKMTENLAYLAERARREDERLVREREHDR